MAYHVVSHELCHYGILGQKWGVRRFQNSDGSLTEAGKKRYFKNYDGQSYELNDKGKRIESREYANRYAVKKDKTLENKIERVKKEMLDDFWFYQSSKSLKTMINDQEYASKILQKHIDAINSGELFTRKYYDTKINAAAAKYRSEAASKILNERNRLYNEAKNNDRWSIDYLEIRPDDVAESSNKKMQLKDYESWLNDPRSYYEKRYAK